ncbi:hypothetical protein N7476_010047 [Penicillium atrosanguineum]|uniref:C2H2-type domain-containing protein n=1 Tax=Penicillium atrosanguineum TaxID=1132637 RepID=A0A9W9PQU1_9EURO|nr:hypothetical protein N7476_010047 [Penicillium atrosanguineum]
MSSKPYQCQRCPRAFARLEHLQRHDRSHTKEKPYACAQCPKAFTRKDLLARHERLSHQGTSVARHEQSPSPAHPVSDGLDALASVVANHPHVNGLSGDMEQFQSPLSVHRPPMMAQMPNPDPPSAEPTTPMPGSDFSYSLGGIPPGSFDGNDFTSFLDSTMRSLKETPDALFPGLHAVKLCFTSTWGAIAISSAGRLSDKFKGSTTNGDYSNVVPDPSLPSRHALSRCLTGYLTGFHDHYPVVHKPTHDVESMGAPLFLSMAALGARYCREPDTSMRLYQLAKPVTIEHFRRVFQSGTTPAANAALDIDTFETTQALLMLISVSSWFINDPPYHEALSIRSMMGMLLRKDGLNRLPDHDDSWASWIWRERVKRLKLIVFCFFNIHTIVFDIPPVILTEEMTLDLPCSEKEWQAPTAEIWQAERRQSLLEPKFQDALSSLFSPNSEIEQFSSLGGYVLIHALLQDIWFMTKANRLALSRYNRLRPAIAPTADLIAVEQALERWCQCWERNQESSIDPLSPHGPLSFTSAALLRLAYIRLNADCGSTRQLQTWDPVQIATSLKDNLHVLRGDRLTRAALHCAHALSTPVKLGIGFVAHSQVALWSNQHALCSLECAVLLAKWLEAVTVPHPDPGLTEQEARLRDFVLEMVMEVQHGVSREWLLATNTRLSVAVTRLWARLFTADYIWEMVNLIGRSLNSYADLLERSSEPSRTSQSPPVPNPQPPVALCVRASLGNEHKLPICNTPTSKMPAPSPIPASPALHALLHTLHARSLEQEKTVDWSILRDQESSSFDTVMRDKFIALDQDKCELIYHILRAINARTVVEAGTSFGVSTIYLALAVTQNAKRDGSVGKVIATEKEATKAVEARKHWEQAGEEVEGVIDLRVGDLKETLKEDLGVVDFLLLDIWTPLALPVLKLVQPFMKPGAVIMADNTAKAEAGYEELFAYVDAPGSPFRRVTMPYEGGMDMIVYE